MNARATARPPLTAAEQALLWRQVFQNTPSGIFGLEVIRDGQTQTIIDFRYRFINDVALFDVFRRQPDQQHDVTGQLFSTYFPSIRQSPLWGLYQSVLETQQPVEAQGDYLFDGHDLRVKMTVSPINNHEILIAYYEVSENHRNLLALERQSARLRQMLNSTPHAVAVVDAIRDSNGRPVDFRVSMVNQPFEALSGLSASDFAGMPLEKLYRLKAGQMEALVRLMDMGVPLRHEQYVHSLDRWFDIMLTRTDDGFVATLHDITSQKKSLDQLERQAQLLDGLMNTVQNGISVLEAIRDEAGRLMDFCFLDASQALFNGLGLSRAEVINNRLLALLPGLRDTTIWPICLRVLETGEPRQFEHHYKADGFDQYFDISLARLNDGLVVSYTNISNAKRAQAQLEALVIELRRSNESLDQFAYVASHDLQEPLRKIVSFGDVLQQQFAPELSDSAADLIRRMQGAASRMRTLVRDLLTYSRLTGQPAQFESVPLDQLVGNVMADFSELIKQQRAQVTVNPLPVVWGDSRLLAPLFQNLISNALKFCQPGIPPRVDIMGQVVENPPTLPGQARCAKIQVKDHGIGFDEKYLDRIFTVFQRLHGQQHYPGTGIGLAICKKVVELHGGTITAESQPQAGATFTVWLPLA